MAKANLGTKRVCPETGKKFYDLAKDPIVSPYTSKEYPVSFFEGETPVAAPVKEEAKSKEEVKTEAVAETAETEEEATLETDGPEIISLEDAEDDDDDDSDSDDEEIPDIPDIPDIEVEDDDDEAEDNTFLEDDDEDDDLSDVIVGVEGGDDET